MTEPSGPPYRPQIWALGGVSEKHIDIPVSAVFIFLFLCGAATHMTLFQLNKKRGHKFLFNLFLFIFCMARVATNVLRIASTSLPSNNNLAIAASIFVAAGVLIIFIVNLLFAQRILRSMHPRIGWHPVISIAFKVLYGLVACTLVVVITATVQSFFTLRPRTRKIDRSLQLYGSTLFAVISFLPILIIAISLALPRRSTPEKFGQGRLRTQILTLVVGTLLVSLGATFRCGTSWKHPVPFSQPRPTYFSKACFYIFNFTVEIMVVYFYAIMRVDLRFWIPNGAQGPGSYTTGPVVAETGKIVEAKQGHSDV